jgi:hypothetical protein
VVVIKPWRWVRLESIAQHHLETYVLRDGNGDNRCTIWRTVDGHMWHTWTVGGVGGENDTAPTLNDAKDQAIAAIVRQGWAPGGWKVVWS